jgi:hypothetical protein
VHERYLYPALAVVVLIAFDAPATLALLVTLTATLFINLIWVHRFHVGLARLDLNSLAVMGIGLINVAAFAVAAFHLWVAATPNETLSEAWPPAVRWFFTKWSFDAIKASSAASVRNGAAGKSRRPAARRRR